MGEQRDRVISGDLFALVRLQLQGMDAELRTAPAAYRSAMSAKLRLHRRDLGKLQREMASSELGIGSSARPTEGGHQGIYSSQNQQSVSDRTMSVD